MKEINETNYCILTGMLINKGRNADTKDMKRPVLDIEIVNTDSNGEISFVEIPVLLSDVVLSKAVPGYYIGEILTVSGELRVDDSSGIYIEANAIVRLQPKTERLRSLAISRSDLLQMTQRFNLASIVGIVNEDSTVTVQRDVYSRGDLKKEDKIPISLLSVKDIPIGEKIFCTGKLGNTKNCPSLNLYISNLYVLV